MYEVWIEGTTSELYLYASFNTKEKAIEVAESCYPISDIVQVWHNDEVTHL